jgi:hypothetical protein
MPNILLEQYEKLQQPKIINFESKSVQKPNLAHELQKYKQVRNIQDSKLVPPSESKIETPNDIHISPKEQLIKRNHCIDGIFDSTYRQYHTQQFHHRTQEFYNISQKLSQNNSASHELHKQFNEYQSNNQISSKTLESLQSDEMDYFWKMI